jgi:hypothetical protein
VHLPQRGYVSVDISPRRRRLDCPHDIHQEGIMSIIRSGAIALSLSLALPGCVGNPDDTQSTAVVGAANASEPSAPPRDYYGRTEFEIPGGDGQVLDYQ